MPYSIARGRGCSPAKPWAVVKDTDGSVVACHETKESALRQIRALYAAEPQLAKAREQSLKADAKAPPKDRITGSDTNEEGSASGKGGEIELSEATDAALQNKVTIHNKKMDDNDRPAWTRVSIGALRSVYRRGSGAYSVSHRPGIGRSQWAMARVNAFLTLASSGKPENAKYVGDNDLLHSDHPRATKNVAKHLPHQHDQQKHSTGGTGQKRNKKDIAADDRRAFELYASGKTWDQVAQEMGFANGGVARRAGKRHEERTTGGGTPPTPDPTPPKPAEVVVTPPPRPAPSTQATLTATDSLEIAVQTGMPYKPFTPEGASKKIQDAEADYHNASRRYGEAMKPVQPLIAEERAAVDAHMKRRSDRDKELKDAQPNLSYAERDAILRKEGLDFRSARMERDLIEEARKSGRLSEAEVKAITDAATATGIAGNRMREAIEDDTLFHVAGIETRRVPDTGPWAKPGDTKAEYFDSKTGQPIDSWNINGPDAGGRVPLAKEMTSYRVQQYEQRRHLSDARAGVQHRDKVTQENIDGALAYQQRLISDPNTRIIVFAPANRVAAIAESGRLKTQAETGRSMGYRDKEGTVRPGFEGATFGIHPDTDPSKRPIYGVLAAGGVRESGAFGAEQYGEVGFVMKREVHGRSSYTDADSLGTSFAAQPLTGPVTTPNWVAGYGGINPQRTAQSAERRVTTERRPAVGYHEAQIFGGVNLSDVEYVIAPKGKVSAPALKKLRAAGVKVVEIDSENLQTEKPSGSGKDRNVPDHFTADGLWGMITPPADKARWTVVANLWRYIRPSSVTIEPTVKHLRGKHDQRSHGRGGGPSASTPSLKEKQKAAWELHEQGKTWEEVAKEVGYANGGAARKAGLLHKKRLDEEGGGTPGLKPELKPDPTPKPSVGGDAAIAQARAVVDKATGGRPVAEVLAEERAKAGFGPPTAKEQEIELAITESGRILRGEVERRNTEAGREVVKKAEADLPELESDVRTRRQFKDEAQQRLDGVKRDLFRETENSPEMERELRTRAESAVTRPGRHEAIQKMDRETVKQDIRQAHRRRAEGSDEYEPDVNKRDEWIAERARERFPDSLDMPRGELSRLRNEYEGVLQDAWSVQNRVARQVGDRDPKVKGLLERREDAKDAVNNATRDIWDAEKQVAITKQVIADKGVTPEINAQNVRDVLTASGRTMTSKPGQKIKGTKPVVEELRAELVKIPDELWDDQKYPNLNVKAVKRGRGHWNSGKQEIKTDGDVGSGRRESTLLHEAMHASEYMNKQVTQLEYAFLDRRAKGRPAEKLSKLKPSHRYRRDEVAIADEFTNPYSGKIYSRNRTSAFEVMTMGIESLYWRRKGGSRYPTEGADDDHLNFVMGVLAHA